MNRTIRTVGNDEWELASYVVERHPGLWTIAFQHDTTAGGLLAAGGHRAVRPRGRGLDRGGATGARQARGPARPLDRDGSLGLAV
jgi:hypothetical protein